MANIIDFIRETLKEDFFDLSSIRREIADITSRYPKEKFLTMKMDEWVKLGDPYCMYSVGYMIVKDQKPFIEKSIGYAWIRRVADAGEESVQKFLNNL